MAKVINITANDLRHMINEVCRKVILLRESIEEGGAYGHMENLHDINDFTFSILKNLVRDVFNGKLENVSEKLDGMNIFATVTPKGEVQFARNGEQIKGEDTGMGIPEMEARWGGEGNDPSILNAYKNAYYLFSDAVAKLKDPVGFFNGDGYKLYANCEVLDPEHPNIIYYGKKLLSVHGLVAYTTGPEVVRTEIPQEEEDRKMGILKQILPTVESQYGATQVTPNVNFKGSESNPEELIAKFTSDIDNLKKLSGINDDGAKIIDYKEAMIIKDIKSCGLGGLLGQPFSELLLSRWSYFDKTKAERPEHLKEMPTLTQVRKIIRTSGVENAAGLAEDAYSYEKTRLGETFNNLMLPIELFVYRLGNAAVKLFRGFSNEGQEEVVIASLRKQLEDAKVYVANSNDAEEGEKLARCLNSIQELGYEFNAMEGIVFNYGGHTVKLTGSFSPLNRAINSKMTIQRKQRKNQA